MSFRFLCQLIFFSFLFGGFQATAQSGSEVCEIGQPYSWVTQLRKTEHAISSTVPTMAQQQCQDDHRYFRCADFETDEESKKLLLKCDQEEHLGGDLAAGVWGCAMDIIGGLKHIATESIPNHIKAQPGYQARLFDFARQNFLRDCQKSSECLTELYKAAHRTEPSAQDIESLKGAWFSKLDYIWNRAWLRGGGFGSASTPWMQKQVELISQRAGLKPTSPESGTDLVQVFKNLPQLLKKEGARLACLNREARIKTACHILLAGAGLNTAAKALMAKTPGLSRSVTMAKSEPHRMRMDPMWNGEDLHRRSMSYLSDESRARVTALEERAFSQARTPAVDVSKLAAQLSAKWNPSASLEQNLALAFRLYSDERVLTDPQFRNHLRKVLRKVDHSPTLVGPHYNPTTRRLSMDAELSPGSLEYLLVKAHEFEHAAQYPNSAYQTFANSQVLSERLRRMLVHSPTTRFQAEIEAVGAQWDFLNVVPVEQRLKSLARLQADSNLNPAFRHLVSRAIEDAHLPREAYVRRQTRVHGYNGIEDLQSTDLARRKLKDRATDATHVSVRLGLAYYIIHDAQAVVRGRDTYTGSIYESIPKPF